VAFLLTFPLNRMVGRTFIPDEDTGEFTVHMDTPQGTYLAGREAVTKSVAAEVGRLEGVSHMMVTAGADRYNHFHLVFYLLPANERKVTQDQVAAQVRKALARHPGRTPTPNPR